MGISRPAISTAVVAALIGSLGVPILAGTASAKDGAATVREDFDGDGHQDVAVAAPGAKVGGHARAGYITIDYGSAHGFDTERTTVITQDTHGVPGDSGDNHAFGYAMIARDLDADGLTDLAVVTRDYRPEENGNGSVTVLWGRQTGISGQDAVRTGAPANAQVGDDITAGDFDSDGNTDLFMRNGEDYDYHDVLYGPFGRDGVPAREQQVKVYSTDNSINSTAKPRRGRQAVARHQGRSVHCPATAELSVQHSRRRLRPRWIRRPCHPDLPERRHRRHRGGPRHRQGLLRFAVRPQPDPHPDDHAEHGGCARGE